MRQVHTLLTFLLLTCYVVSQHCQISRTIGSNEEISAEVFQNQPIYFNVTTPAPKGPIQSDPTILITVRWSSCGEDTLIKPSLFLGKSGTCPNEKSNQRHLSNMTFWDDPEYVQIMQIRPTELVMGPTFVISISQRECPKAKIRIKTQTIDETPMTSNTDIRDVTYPGIRRYFNFTINNDYKRSGISPFILIASLQYHPFDEDDAHVIVYSAIDSYPSGNLEKDIVFPTHTFTLTTLKYGSFVRFFVTVNESLSTEQQYTQQKYEIHFMVKKGTMCSYGCGLGGECNFETGKCQCRNDKGFWGASCSDRGCVQGEECKVTNGKGVVVCNGPDPSKSTCNVTSCDNDPLLAIDKSSNTCVRVFPTDIFASSVGGTGAVSLVLGIVLTSFICAAVHRRRHYHFLE